MKTQNLNIKGFTLLEVIVASSVVGIVMLGIVTVSVSLQKSSRDSSNSYFVEASTQTSINHILKDASQAVGTPSSPGIVGVGRSVGGFVSQFYVTDYKGSAVADPYLALGSAYTFCLNQKYSWMCYTFLTPKIYWCVRELASPSACTNADNYLGTAKSVSTAFSIKSCNTALCTAAQNSSQKALFEVTIENCLDPTIASCCDPSDTVACTTADSGNPYVSKSGSVSPPGHSAS